MSSPPLRYGNAAKGTLQFATAVAKRESRDSSGQSRRSSGCRWKERNDNTLGRHGMARGNLARPMRLDHVHARWQYPRDSLRRNK